MNYLEQKDEGDWVIDPASQVNDLDLDQIITDLCDRLRRSDINPHSGETDLRLVITGALELARRTDAPLAQCLDTSMIWCYG